MADAPDTDDALGLAARIAAGELSAVEATEAAIARIEAADPEINAVVVERFEQALAEAGAGLPAGPFTGVPFAVKSLGPEVAGMAATRGSRLWADCVPAADSVLVSRYRAAGLVVLGATNTPELGRNGSTEPVLHGPTRNPWRTTHSPGGSSGGAAAAVAAGMLPAAHGNDGGGSIRIPSSCCGLFGLKPSRGRVPMAPAPTSLAYPLGIDHALTTTVRDSAALLDVVAGAVPGAAFAAPGGGPFLPEVGADPGRLRIALWTTPTSGIDVDAGCLAVARRAADLCAELGHEVVERGPQLSHDELLAASGVLMSVPLAHHVDQRLAELGRELRDDDLEPFTHQLLARGRAVTGPMVIAALETVESLGHRLGAFLADVDLLLTPTMAIPVPELGMLDTTRPETMYQRGGGVAAFTALFNATGQPAMSVPLGSDSTGMPTGAQFVGRFGEEATLFRLAAQLEAAAPWPRRAAPR